MHRLASGPPADCPPLKIRWFYAVDVAKRMPSFSGFSTTPQKPKGPPKKFVPFSVSDSRSIENAFQELIEQGCALSPSTNGDSPQDSKSPNTRSYTVPVNEDFLFDVDILKREVSPVYWIGPTYEIRRGSWFFQDGSSLKPCEENLAAQLEEGYLKIRPWKHNYRSISNVSSISKDSISSSDSAVPKSSKEAKRLSSGPTNDKPVTYRLLGSYMNNVVTYQDATTALLCADDFMSRMSSTVYQTFGGVPGTRVIRGYTEPTPKTKDGADSKEDDKNKSDGTSSKFRSTPGTSQSGIPKERTSTSDDRLSEAKSTRDAESEYSTVGQSLSFSLMDEADPSKEAAPRKEEQEMEALKESKDEERGREIDHLVLVTHGIGQRLGLRMESISFIHDINVLRKTMKRVYAASPNLQALNSDITSKSKNCRVQVLPVSWRHLLDFPMQGIKHNRRELDLADADKPQPDDAEYPSLGDITLEGVPQVRNLLTDLALDVLFYQNPVYRDHIAKIVVNETHRILKIFKQRNPGFNGTISFCGHSLGSAIMFDILCRQPPLTPNQHPMSETSRFQRSARSGGYRSFGTEYSALPLDFECAHFFCLGSPLALFQMLQGKKIAAEESLPPQRSAHRKRHSRIDPFEDSEYLENISTISRPRCGELYNIFHPSDPISYRMEPLISPALANLRPQALPFIKRSLWNTPGQSLTNISVRVGQSVGSLWSNFTSGVASSLLNRSLGINEGNPPQPSVSSSSVNRTSSPGPRSAQFTTIDSNKRSSFRAQLASGESSGNRSPIDDNDAKSAVTQPSIETLYDGFQKRRLKALQERRSFSDADDISQRILEADAHARRLGQEDAKVRALNSNGRVDYSIQESALDISLIGSIASHLTYWSDEDVVHFMMSQILSHGHRRPKPATDS